MIESALSLQCIPNCHFLAVICFETERASQAPCVCGGAEVMGMAGKCSAVHPLRCANLPFPSLSLLPSFSAQSGENSCQMCLVRRLLG